MTSHSKLLCLLAENWETCHVEKAQKRCQAFLSMICFTQQERVFYECPKEDA